MIERRFTGDEANGAAGKQKDDLISHHLEGGIAPYAIRDPL